jgi:hypothetical protein
MSSLNHMFYIPIITLKVINWEEKKKKLVDKYKTLQLKYHEKDHVKTNYHEDYLSLVPHVVDVLGQELQEFIDVVKLPSCEVVSAWFELSRKGDYHQVHHHGPTGFSSVCFIEFCNNVHEPTLFLSPFNNFLTGEELRYTPDVCEGTIIFFPSSILHYTEPNLSDKERLILSFNLKFPTLIENS